MKKGGRGGGRTITGLRFESRITLEKAISALPNYKVSDDKVYFKGKKTIDNGPNTLRRLDNTLTWTSRLERSGNPALSGNQFRNFKLRD